MKYLCNYRVDSAVPRNDNCKVYFLKNDASESCAGRSNVFSVIFLCYHKSIIALTGWTIMAAYSNFLLDNIFRGQDPPPPYASLPLCAWVPLKHKEKLQRSRRSFLL